MPAWKAIEEAEPEFAGRVRRLFDAGRQDDRNAARRRIATHLRHRVRVRGGRPALRFDDRRKGADLRRDPRFALHGPTFHPEKGRESDWSGEAKIAGRAIPVRLLAMDEASEQSEGEMFVADIVVITRLDAEATKLTIESWTPE